MIFIAGKPIIQYVIESLASNGIKDIKLIVGYQRDQVFDYIGDGKRFGVKVDYITQSKQLGTAQALSQASGATEDEFIVLPGDKLITPETIMKLVGMKPPAMLVKQVQDPSRYGVVRIEKGQIIDINEKPPIPQNNLINTGIYIFEKNIFELLSTKLDIPEVINDLLQKGESIAAIETDQPWLDVIYPWDILSLNSAILDKKLAANNGIVESGVSLSGPVSIGRGTIIRSNSYLQGPIVLGNNCEIGPYACILPSTTLANDVKIAPFTRIKNSVIGDNVTIGSGSEIEDSVIANNCNLGSHFCAFSEETEINMDWQVYVMKIGAMIGEGCEIGSSVVAQPGLIAGNYCKIKSLKVINGKLIDKSIVC